MINALAMLKTVRDDIQAAAGPLKPVLEMKEDARQPYMR